MTLCIWCYACGQKWLGLAAAVLWNNFARCPKCNGYTDAVNARVAIRGAE